MTFRTVPLYSVVLDTGLVLRTYIGRLDSTPVHYLNLFKSSLHTSLDSSSTIRSESSLRIASHSALRTPTSASASSPLQPRNATRVSGTPVQDPGTPPDSSPHSGRFDGGTAGLRRRRCSTRLPVRLGRNRRSVA